MKRKGLEDISDASKNRTIQIRPWEDKDLDFLFLINSEEMTAHIGGPESIEEVFKRHKRYLELGSNGCMFIITLFPDLNAVGSVGYWQSEWNEEKVYEIGWSVLPPFQKKGIATIATDLVLQEVKALRNYKYIHAFPSINNPASNAICRKLDFKFISECVFEYPLGNFMQCNNWRLELNWL